MLLWALAHSLDDLGLNSSCATSCVIRGGFTVLSLSESRDNKCSINVSNSCCDCYCFTIVMVIVIIIWAPPLYLTLFMWPWSLLLQDSNSLIWYHLPPGWLWGLNEIMFVKYLAQCLAHSNCFYRWTQLMSH